MSTHSTNSLQPARRQYFIKSDALSRNSQQPVLLTRNTSEPSLDQVIKSKPIPPLSHPKTNDLPGILALALKESSTDNNSPIMMKSDRSYFEVGRSMRRISLSQSGVRVERSLEVSCVANDCPNKNVRVHYEELKNEYNEKIREIRRLTKLLEVGERRDTIQSHINKIDLPSSIDESETVQRLRNEIDVIKLKNKSLENDLNYADVMMEKLKLEISKKEEMLLRCRSYTEDQMKYIESTTKPNIGNKRDSIKTVKALKATLIELEKSNRSLTAHNTKLVQEIEDLKSNYTDVCLKFERSELNRSKASGSHDSKTQDKMIKDLQSEKRLLTEDIRTLKDAHSKALEGYEEKLEKLTQINEELTQNCKFIKDDSTKLKLAYDKLLKMSNELESANSALKAQFKDQKHHSDTLDREKANLEDEIETLKVKYVTCTKEKSEIERKLFDLNEKISDIYSLIHDDKIKNQQADFNNKSIDLITDGEIEAIRIYIVSYLEGLTSNGHLADRKDDSHNTTKHHNPFNSISVSVSEQRYGVESDKKLSSRLVAFITSMKNQTERVRGDHKWFDSTTNELINDVCDFEAKTNEQVANFEGLQQVYSKLKEDSDKTSYMLSSLIEALNIDIKRKTKVWASFSPGLDQTNYTLVCKLAQALELTQLEHEESDLRQSHRSEDIPSPSKSRQKTSNTPLARNLFAIKPVEAQVIKKQKEATQITDSSNPNQLLLLSHLMSNRETESLASQPRKQSMKEAENVIEALRSENELLRRQIAKMDVNDQSLSKTNDNIVMNFPPKGLICDEHNGVDIVALYTKIEHLQAENETLHEDNDILLQKINEASIAIRTNGLHKANSDIYDLINQTNFFPYKVDDSDVKIDGDASEGMRSDPVNDEQSLEQNNGVNYASYLPSRKPTKTNTFDYDESNSNNSNNDDLNDGSVGDSANEFCFEFENDVELNNFIKTLIVSHKEEIEDLRDKHKASLDAMKLEMNDYRIKFNDTEIELKKLQLELKNNDKPNEELEYYKVKLASLELANKIGGQLKPVKNSSRPESSRRRSKNEDESFSTEFKNMESLNSELSTTVYRLSSELHQIKQENHQLKQELEDLRERGSVSGFIQNNSELLNSEVYQLNLSDLNPNKTIAQMVQKQITTDDAIRLQDHVTLLEERQHNSMVEIETLKTTLKSLEKENRELKHRKIELEKDVELLSEELSQQGGQLAHIKSKIMDSKTSLVGLVDQTNMENDVKRLQSQIINLNDTLFKLNRTNEQLIAESLKVSTENKALIDERRKLSSQLYKLSAKSLHKDGELEKKTYRLSNALFQVAILKSELERLALIRN